MSKHFGHGPLAQKLCSRLELHQQHFFDKQPTSGVDPGFTVGIMGSWGSGKSQMLDTVYRHFTKTTEATPDSAQRVVAVRFNAWRYERDPNLITPLLHTLHQTLSQTLGGTQHTGLEGGAANPQTPAAAPAAKRGLWHRVKQLASFTSRAAQAFASVGSAELTITLKGDALAQLASVSNALPGVDLELLKDALEGELKLTLSPKDAVSAWQSSAPKEETPPSSADQTPPTHSPSPAATYHDFEQQLSRLTQPANDGTALYLLFLIDDLDRCLPEKALEMLETIKLFFNIPACGFVLALDDDVIERGVLHRYRDYLFHQSTAEAAHPPQLPSANAPHATPHTAPQLPITGAEYLEKIIQLPVRLPLPTGAEAEDLLRSRHPQLFDHRKLYEQYKELARQAPPTTPTPDDNNAPLPELLLAQAQLARDLCTLFHDAVPPLPRKLLRAAQALQLAQDTMPPRSPAQALMQARLVVWQLFAPELYRYCHRKPDRFKTVANWHHMAHQNSADLQWLCGERASYDPQGLIAQSLQTVQGNDLQLALRLRDFVVTSYRQRSEFDLGKLFERPYTSDAATAWPQPRAAAEDPRHPA